MEGIEFNRRGAQGLPEDDTGAATTLLARHDNLEIMWQHIDGESIVWLTPAADPKAAEFFFIHAGGVELALDDGMVCLGPGESFTVSGLTRDIPVKILSEARILYVTNSPAFEAVRRFEESLIALLMRINEKDNYTYRHSGAVLRYSLRLYDALETEVGSASRDDLAVAALFHDVGKCFVPVEILTKRAELESSEVRYILRHPVDSGRLLLTEFGDAASEIARNHHERLDGSGYPRGLRGEEISLLAKVVAAADVFDAMTSDRGYNVVKSFEAAADELCSLPDKFDPVVTGALKKLVSEGALRAEEKTNE